VVEPPGGVEDRGGVEEDPHRLGVVPVQPVEVVGEVPVGELALGDEDPDPLGGGQVVGLAEDVLGPLPGDRGKLLPGVEHRLDVAVGELAPVQGERGVELVEQLPGQGEGAVAEEGLRGVLAGHRTAPRVE
jgi:hypothetical protein